MKKVKKQHWSLLLCCAILALSLQSCLGIGDNNTSPFQPKGGDLQVNTSQQARFQGKIYFTVNRNLYVLDGKLNSTQLTHDIDVRDPAVSPDGKWVAFINHFKYYSDLVYMSTGADHTQHIVVSGSGNYYPNQDVGANNYYWFAQPSWSADSKQLLFLSDLEKEYYWSALGAPYSTAYFLDMQVYSLPITASLTAKQAIKEAQDIGYAVYGDGGNRDPSYRPNHPEQVSYTTFHYDPAGTKQIVQIVLEDTNLMIKKHYPAYHPGYDPSVALTPATPDLVNFQPSFSPDGNTLTYMRREDATHMSIYAMSVPDGVANDPNNARFDPNTADNQAKALAPYSQATKLMTERFLSLPIWSPDGTQLLYYGFANNTFDLWLVTLNKDKKTGALSVKANSQIQLTNATGHLDADSRADWTA